MYIPLGPGRKSGPDPCGPCSDQPRTLPAAYRSAFYTAYRLNESKTELQTAIIC